MKNRKVEVEVYSKVKAQNHKQTICLIIKP